MSPFSSLIYTSLFSLSIYILFCSGKLHSRTQITLLPPPLFKNMKNNSSTPLLSCYSLSVLLKLSSANSIALPVFPFQVPLFSASMVMAQSKITMDLSDTDLFSCLQTITVDIPSSCEYHAGNRSHKLQSSKVINGTGKLLSAWVILCLLPSSLIVCLSVRHKAFFQLQRI